MSQTVIDLTVYEELKSTTGADFVKDLVQTFLTEAPGMLNELRGAYDANDAERFRRAAHSLKSNGNTFGALGFGALARKLELDGLTVVKAADGKPLDALAREYTDVAKALTELKDA